MTRTGLCSFVLSSEAKTWIVVKGVFQVRVRVEWPLGQWRDATGSPDVLTASLVILDVFARESRALVTLSQRSSIRPMKGRS